MFDPETLRQLSSQPVDEVVRALERLHQSQSELPVELRRPAVPAAAVPAAAVPEAPAGEAVVREALAPEAAPALAVPPVAPTDLADGLRSMLGEYEGLLRRYNEDFDRLLQHQARAAASPLVDVELRYGSGVVSGADDPEATLAIIERLKRAQLLFLKFPIAAQAAFAAFVEEGRQYAQTADGMRWKQALSRSPLLERVSRVLSPLSLGALREQPDTVLPSAVLDLLVSVASSPELGALLSRAFAAKEPR
ncbi:MAG: hypothetical protein ABI895_19265 [Deltaproteobacteria bacterium]